MRNKIKTVAATGIDIIPFYGDEIDLVLADDGQGYAILKRMCERLTIAHLPQRTKLNGYGWARKMIIILPDARRRSQGLYALNINDVPAWLMSIKLGRVAFAAREKLALYQAEAAAVLAAWFLGKTSDLARIVREDPEAEARLNASVAAIQDLQDQLADERRQHAETRHVCDFYRGRCERFMAPIMPSDHDYMTLREFINRTDMRLILGSHIRGDNLVKIGDQLVKLSGHYGVEVRRVPGPGRFQAKMFHLTVLQTWLRLSETGIALPAREFGDMLQARLPLY